MPDVNDTASRRKRRAERLRRERMRMHRQRAALVGVLVLGVLLTVAWMMVPPTPPLARAKTMITADSGIAAVAGIEAVLIREGKRAAAEESRPKPLVPAPGVRTLIVDKSDQTVTAYEKDGTPVDRFRCASGVMYPRVGEYEVYGKDDRSWALADDTTFYWFTKFVKSDKGNNIGFHSIPQNPDGTLVGGLGKPVSHGCVRVDKTKAKFIYDWAPIGARVVVRY